MKNPIGNVTSIRIAPHIATATDLVCIAIYTPTKKHETIAKRISFFIYTYA